MKQTEPQIKNRFSSSNQPKEYNKNKPKKYLTPLLKKFLNKKINFEDPETQEMIRGTVKDAIIWRLLLSACQGEISAIKEIFERLEGKTILSTGEEGSKGNTKVVVIVQEARGNQGQERRLPVSVSVEPE